MAFHERQCRSHEPSTSLEDQTNIAQSPLGTTELFVGKSPSARAYSQEGLQHACICTLSGMRAAPPESEQRKVLLTDASMPPGI